MAEVQAQLQEWEACAGSVALAIQHLPEMVAEFPTHIGDALGVHCFERGIQRIRSSGFRRALALCERAVALDLGRTTRQSGFVELGRRHLSIAGAATGAPCVPATVNIGYCAPALRGS